MTEQPPNSTAPLGKAMMLIAWVIALVLLAAFFTSWEEKAYNPNADPNSQQTANTNSVTLTRNRFNHYITGGSINQQPVTFLLDTGATDVVVPEELANTLGLSKGRRQTVNTANGQIEVFNTQIDQLSIGSIVLRNIRGNINPYMQGEEILLGMSALKDIEFTQRGDQLQLRQYR